MCAFIGTKCEYVCCAELEGVCKTANDADVDLAGCLSGERAAVCGTKSIKLAQPGNCSQTHWPRTRRSASTVGVVFAAACWLLC